MTTDTAPARGRDQLVRRATLLNRLPLGWNAVEGIVAIAAGVAASSVSLVAFGLDSGIEVSAAIVLAWRLHQERRAGCQLPADDRARRLVAWSFAALAAYVSISAIMSSIYTRSLAFRKATTARSVCIHLFLCSVHFQGAEHGLKLRRFDGSGPILIEDLESILHRQHNSTPGVRGSLNAPASGRSGHL